MSNSLKKIGANALQNQIAEMHRIMGNNLVVMTMHEVFHGELPKPLVQFVFMRCSLAGQMDAQTLTAVVKKAVEDWQAEQAKPVPAPEATQPLTTFFNAGLTVAEVDHDDVP